MVPLLAVSHGESVLPACGRAGYEIRSRPCRMWAIHLPDASNSRDVLFDIARWVGWVDIDRDNVHDIDLPQ